MFSCAYLYTNFLHNFFFRYGYLTNTKVKFILVTTDLDVRDADVRNVSVTICVQTIGQILVGMYRYYC